MRLISANISVVMKTQRLQAHTLYVLGVGKGHTLYVLGGRGRGGPTLCVGLQQDNTLLCGLSRTPCEPALSLERAVEPSLTVNRRDQQDVRPNKGTEEEFSISSEDPGIGSSNIPGQLELRAAVSSQKMSWEQKYTLWGRGAHWPWY